MFKYLEGLSTDSEKGIVLDTQIKKQFISYQALYASAVELAKLLSEYKFEDYVILYFENKQFYFEFFWALVYLNLQPLIISHDHHINRSLLKLEEFLVSADECSLLSDLDVMSLLSKNNSMDERLSVTEISKPVNLYLSKRISKRKEYHPNDQNIIFYQMTSGSTGIPKLIPETLSMIETHVESSKIVNKYLPSDVVLNWLPLEHVVPMITYHLRAVMLNNTQVHVDTASVLSDPSYWLKLIEDYQVTHTWAPNFGYELLLEAIDSSAMKLYNLISIKQFMNAGEPIHSNTSKKFIEFLNKNQLSAKAYQPAFGMAEMATCISYCNNFDLSTSIKTITFEANNRTSFNSFVSCGELTPGNEVKILDDEHNELAQDELGNLYVKSRSLFNGYKNRDADIDTDGWFNTGDLAFIHNNELYLAARSYERISINGSSYYSHWIEEKITHKIKAIYLTYISSVLITDNNEKAKLVIGFSCPESLINSTIEEIKNTCLAWLGVTPLVLYFPRKNFPKATTGKKQRTKLGVIAKKIYLQQENFRIVYPLKWQRFVNKGQESNKKFIVISDDESYKEKQSVLIFLNINQSVVSSLEERLENEIKNDDTHVGIIYCIKEQNFSVKKDSIEWSKWRVIKILELLEKKKIKAEFYFIYDNEVTALSTSIDELFIQIQSVIAKSFQARFSTPIIKIEFDRLDFERLESCVNYLNKIELRHNELRFDSEGLFSKELVPMVLWDSEPMPAKKNWCIVTGGLSSLGKMILLEIAQSQNCNLYILGRRAKDELSKQDEQVLNDIGDRGFEVQYRQCELTDEKSVKLSLKDLNKNDCQTIVHLAGVYHSSVDLDWGQEQCAVAFFKLKSLIYILNTMKDLSTIRKIISFSSIYSYQPILGVESYAVSNALIDLYLELMNRVTKIEFVSVLCPIVKGYGLSSNVSEALLEELSNYSIDPKIFKKQIGLLLYSNISGNVLLNQIKPKVVSCLNALKDDIGEKRLDAIILDAANAISDNHNVEIESQISDYLLDSMHVIRFCMRLEKTLNLKINPGEIFGLNTFKDLKTIIHFTKGNT